ncbi:hypothetical protein DXG03_002807 [Asterophora parasitica]|uniref:Zn(2)-C6 fungal-type domain-containing protein n=1 Tax=Asterophora parasitica TaxID=117018 RepID=A0A9P7K9N1_9AGAR|nr:hypothetical protein DXG03_002807 [Asterophora parasitica]
MSNSYNNNHSWAQQQGVFGQAGQPSQMGDFDFTLPGNSDDIQHQAQSDGVYAYHPSQLQLPSGSGSSSSVMNSNFARNQPHSRSSSYGNVAPINTTSYGSSANQSQNIGSYNATFPPPVQEHLWRDTSVRYGRPVPNNPNFVGSSISGAVNDNYLSASSSAMQDVFPQSSPSRSNTQTPHYSLAPTATTADPRAKRARSNREDARDDEQDSADAAKPKAGGACARCKNLKVKCEFKTETDPCKRCLNGGHECMIPGRKKRRTPPKREHLLNQIREQAAQIKDLMSQLESTGNPQRRSSSITSDSFGSSHSPLLSPATSHTSFVSSEAQANAPEADAAANKAVEEWIAKAKQSFEDFDVFIGIGGAGMPQSYLVEEDLEENPDDYDPDDEYDIVSDNEHGSEYEIAVEHYDGDDVTLDQGTLRHKASSSSIGTNGTGATHQTRKKAAESSKPAILPGEAAPFGLFGKLSLKTPVKRGDSAEVEEADKAPGIANTNFFRPTPGTTDKRLSNFQHPPLILTRKVITPTEAEQLFQIYFDKMNLSLSLLDPVLYTAQRTCYRSPLLFTVSE